MSESAATNGAEKPTSSWYLARGDQQWGPLADRELLLLAERGGLKTDDLLWRPGFESWKPVRDVAGELTESRSPHSTSPANGAANHDVETAPVAEPNHEKPSLRARLLDELKSFLIMFSYLWLVFSVFLVHEWSVLASHQIGFRFYGFAVVNALILSKIMLIAEGMHFARHFEDKPLIYPIAYKSIAFTVLLMAAYIVEEIAVGLFHGKTVAESFPEIGGGGLAGVLTIGAIMGIALVPFFSFREIARVVGVAEFRTLMLGAPREKRSNPSREAQPVHS
jgi:GYF domain 2